VSFLDVDVVHASTHVLNQTTSLHLSENGCVNLHATWYQDIE